ncbi:MULTISPECIES: flagellar protein FlaG [Shouchella]|uniref:Flagellar protein FlaG n=2 Tax=Shouchella TaxID=2893057 RepID=A0ABY7W6F7_9BACI|nr:MULTISPECIES: flagellar protein FlaG [Shouchella]MED4129036.1 flagellar protein FlaG [Shouchella miscanthi]WDF04444.1 flagellar protein FlaG [Shouchella hunanensis]GAF21759.1 flagellar protein FlaG [Bacillus sp. JCM 19047]
MSMEIQSAGVNRLLESNSFKQALPQAKQQETLHDEKQMVVRNKPIKRALSFHIHTDLDRVYVKVIDSDTDEVVREVPPEQLLDLLASMMKSAGLIIDRQV